jgi:ABC-type multidrug transport system fused ATPase/permease subunit
VPEDANAVSFPNQWSQISYKNISFSYANEKLIENFNLTIKRGQVVAFVGESGSGKSTLANLLARYYDPQLGQITIDQLDVKKIKLADLRKNIGLVSQDVFLFSASFRWSLSGLEIEVHAKQSIIITTVAHPIIFVFFPITSFNSPNTSNDFFSSINTACASSTSLRIALSSAVLFGIFFI